MRIGHFQCICRENDFKANLETFRGGLERAQEAGLRILSFPESSLTGYYRDEGEARANAFAVDSPEMRKVLAVAGEFNLMTIVGFNESRGDALYNTAAVIDTGKLVGVYSKVFPIFGYFTPGREFPVFERSGLTFGIIVCADSAYIEPARILALKGARLIFSPHHNYVDDPLDHCLQVRRQHTARAIENQVYVVRGNNVMPAEHYGRPVNGVPYYGYGDSFILDPRGECVAGAGMHDEALMICELDVNRYRRPPDRKSHSRLSAEALLDQLAATVRDAQSGA